MSASKQLRKTNWNTFAFALLQTEQSVRPWLKCPGLVFTSAAGAGLRSNRVFVKHCRGRELPDLGNKRFQHKGEGLIAMSFEGLRWIIVHSQEVNISTKGNLGHRESIANELTLPELSSRKHCNVR